MIYECGAVSPLVHLLSKDASVHTMAVSALHELSSYRTSKRTLVKSYLNRFHCSADTGSDDQGGRGGEASERAAAA